MKYKTLPSSTNLYFVTSTIASHRHLFLTENLAAIVFDSLSWMRKNKVWKLYAFCLMPNHLHIVVEVLNGKPIEKIMGRFHSFTGHKIGDLLEQRQNSDVAQFLKQQGLEKGDREYLIWEDCLSKNIETEHVLLETVEYIHNNPFNKNWNLVDERSDYKFSSACYYDLGKLPIVEVDDMQELLGGTPSR